MNKFSLVLIGLVVMLSGLVAASAYVSNNQLAFVRAQPQTYIEIDFGNVFPGMDVTESFTINSGDTSSYIISLVAPSAAGVLDIRPHLTVWKDPAEGDADGPVSGAPDYTGSGSFTDPGDLSDKWFVTFVVPDVTLGSGIAYDYGCQISIMPIIEPIPSPIPPLPFPPEDLILLPNAAGDLTEFDVPAVGNHWEKVRDDEAANFVSDNGDNETDLYNIENIAIGNSIDSVTFVAVMKGYGFYGFEIDGTKYWGQRKSSPLGGDYVYYWRTFSNQPSGAPWTVAAINDLQVGFWADTGADSGLTATQIYVVVDIIP